MNLANQECLTGSWNGPSLLETLRSISPDEAASTDTYEGYSAWSVALHTLYYKYMVAEEIGADIPSYDYERVNFPSIPEERSQQAWDKVSDDLEATHKGLMKAVADASEERLQQTFESWKSPFWECLMWTISHDINHNAQIRSMGLPSLRKPVK